jgi:hypothetical protein
MKGARVDVGVAGVGIVVAVFGIGCGSSVASNPDGSPSTSLATAEGFCRQLASATAASYDRCYGGTAAQWEANLVRDCAALDAAGIQYNADAARACLETATAVVAADCNASVPCILEVIVGVLVDGAACTNSFECGVQSACLSPDDGLTCAPRVCTPPSPVGGLCQPWCATGLLCDLDTLTCVAATEVPIGGTCTGVGALLCAPGSHCYLDGKGAGVCTETKTGALCNIDGDCRSEDYCDGVCKRRIEIGQPCTDQPTGCKFLATCDQITNRCVAGGVRGEACGAHGSCLNGFCVDGSCEGRRSLGQSCESAFECESGVCRNSLCTDCPR